MIVIEDTIFDSVEMIESFIEVLRQGAYKEEFLLVSDIYYGFLLDCFDADIRLQEMVNDNLSEDLLSFVKLPLSDTENIETYYFSLQYVDGGRVGKRDELIYGNFCDVCFGGVKPFYTRLLEFYQK